MVRTFNKVTLAGAVVLLLIAALAAGLWWVWWVPKTEFSCDSRNRGAVSPKQAAHQFVESLVTDDVDGACAIITNKIGRDALEEELSKIRQQLGAPVHVDAVTITVGAQGGSVFPLNLEGPQGSVGMSVFSFQGWYRVILRVEE